MKISISGWNVGFQKVKFAELLRCDFGYSLASAKAATDTVLENRRLELPIQASQCNRILPLLSEVGVRAVIED
jgi:hypothetical protein